VQQSPNKYKTTNWKRYSAALKSRGSLSVWFDQTMQWRPDPCGQRGHQAEYSDAAIQFFDH